MWDIIRMSLCVRRPATFSPKPERISRRNFFVALKSTWEWMVFKKISAQFIYFCTWLYTVTHSLPWRDAFDFTLSTRTGCNDLPWIYLWPLPRTILRDTKNMKHGCCPTLLYWTNLCCVVHFQFNFRLQSIHNSQNHFTNEYIFLNFLSSYIKMASKWLTFIRLIVTTLLVFVHFVSVEGHRHEHRQQHGQGASSSAVTFSCLITAEHPDRCTKNSHFADFAKLNEVKLFILSCRCRILRQWQRCGTSSRLHHNGWMVWLSLFRKLSTTIHKSWVSRF
jgi:hypothetical protein